MIQNIKNNFLNILFVYKNFLHWSLSKILISFSSYILWFILALPFLILAFIIIYFSPLELSNFFLWWQYLLQDALTNQYWFIIVLLLFVITIISLFIWISYKKVLLAKLNFKYLEKKKLKIRKNYYFNFWVISKFLKINLIILAIIFGISLIFIGLFIILVSIFWGFSEINILLQNNTINSFSIISLILAITLFIILFYLLYRTYFSFFILAENTDYSTIKCLKKSIKKTKKLKIFFKFILTLFIFGIIIFPVTYLWQYIDYKSNNLINYIELKNKSENKENKLNQKEYYIYSALNIEYWKFSNEELLEKYNKNRIIEIIFFVMHFLLIFWLLELIVAKFYKKEIE